MASRADSMRLGRVSIMGLAFMAACVFSCVATSPSLAARCYLVAEPGSGNRPDVQCEEAIAIGNPYVRINRIIAHFPMSNIWCAETEEGGVGNWTVLTCNGPNMGAGKYIKVFEAPNWQIGGDRIPIPPPPFPKLKEQLKGTAALSAKIAGAEVLVACTGSTSEGATLEDNNIGEGQTKGKLSFTTCKVSKPANCSVIEPIVTAQLKSHLVLDPSNKQHKYAALFEPTSGKKLVELKFSGAGCGIIVGTQPVTGSMAAEVSPGEMESKEILLNFPEKPITEVLTASETVIKPALTLGAEPATFAAAYGTTLESGAAFGAFGI